MIRFFAVILMSVFLSGCPFDGDDGGSGDTGATGLSGIDCWDTNGNRVDDQDEDKNFDGNWDALDCAGPSSSAQSQEAELNHQHFCEAFANLGQYPEGCPSAVHTTPAGTLTRLYEDVNNKLFDDGAEGYTSCNNAPSNGLFSIVKRTGTDQAWFELEGAYIANTTTYSRSDEILNNLCFAECDADPLCIGSLAQSKSSEALECLIFYHSDTVSKFEKICGIDTPDSSARELCVAGIGNQQRWSAKCP